MIILKSLAAGLLAVLGTAMAITVLAIAALLVLSARNHADDTSIGWTRLRLAMRLFPGLFCCSRSR
jgi:hypothetical protein